MIKQIKTLQNMTYFNIVMIFVITLVAGVFASLIHLPWPILLWTFILAVMTIRLPKSIGSIMTIRFMMIIFIILALFQLESIIFWLLRLNVNVAVYCSVALVLILIYVVISAIKKEKIFNSNIIKFTEFDFLILMPAVIVCGLLWARTFVVPEKINAAIVHTVSIGTDDAVHASMYSDLIRSNGNLLAGSSNPISIFGDINYPMGWHLSMSIVTSSFFDFNNKPVMDIIRSYVYAKIFSLFCVVIAMCAFMVVLIRQFKFRINSFIEYLAVIISALGVTYIISLSMYLQGFFSFLPVLAYFLLVSIIILDDSRDRQTTTDIILCLLAIASALTWILTAPVLIIIMLIKKVSYYGSIRKVPLTFYVYIVFSILALAVPVYLLATVDTSIETIAALGGLSFPTHMLLLVTFLGFVAFYLYDKKFSALAHRLSLIIVPSAIMLLLILLLISLQSEKITYYYYKFQIVLLAVLLPFICVYVIQQLFKNNRRSFIEQITSLFLLIGLFGLSIPSVVGYEYFVSTTSQVYGHSLPVSDVSLIINQSLNRKFAVDNSRVFFFYPDSRQMRTSFANNVVRLSYIISNCNKKIISGAEVLDIAGFSAGIRQCDANDSPMIIYTDKTGFDQINSTLGKSYLDERKITVKVTN